MAEQIYLYPQVDREAGFFNNPVEEIIYRIGRGPKDSNTGDVQGPGGLMQTFLVFDPPLTAPEKAVVDAIIAYGCAPPLAEALETVFTITDLHENLKAVAAQMNLNPARVRLRYGKSSPEKLMCDRIYLYCGAPLTKQQKSALTAAYAALITEKV